MPALFRAARQNRIFQDVVDQIQEAIIDGRLKAGDKLPAERELKEMLQTSRSTLREALRVLEQKGLIEIRLGMGGGAVVKAVSFEQVTESLDLMIRSQKVPLGHLSEFREGVEGDVVAIAAARATRKDIANLKRLLSDARKWADRGTGYVEAFLEADKKLHLEFARVTGNSVYISVLQTVQENMISYYQKYLPMGETELAENLKDLCDIVEAIETGQSDRARDLAKKHVRRFSRYMEQHQQETTS